MYKAQITLVPKQISLCHRKEQLGKNCSWGSIHENRLKVLARRHVIRIL